MRTPLARVVIALKGPPPLDPGLGSKRSRWLGPPFIQSTMHAFGVGLPAEASRCPSHSAVSAAARPPARVLRKSRRIGVIVSSVVERELARVEERPEEILERGASLLLLGRPSDELGRRGDLGRVGLAAEGAQVE